MLKKFGLLNWAFKIYVQDGPIQITTWANLIGNRPKITLFVINMGSS